MVEEKRVCPHCYRCIGVVHFDKGVVLNIVGCPPKAKNTPRLVCKRFCPRCKGKFYVEIYFEAVQVKFTH